MNEVNPFDAHFREYDAWFDAHPNIYRSELAAVRAVLPPKKGDWLEIGVGSGRFAVPLGIPLGVEPADGIATLARERGIVVVKGRAEDLPVPDRSYDAAFLITTLCFVDDVARAFAEARRILRPGGVIIVAFIPADSPFGRFYRRIAETDRFYRAARFYSSAAVLAALEDAGFRIDRSVQTLTGDPADADRAVEPPSDGHDRGSFVVVRGARSPR